MTKGMDQSEINHLVSLLLFVGTILLISILSRLCKRGEAEVSRNTNRSGKAWVQDYPYALDLDDDEEDL